MITMNSQVTISQTFFAWYKLQNLLDCVAYDCDNINPSYAKNLRAFSKTIQQAFDNLDYTENEALVDKLNKSL